MEKRCWCTVDMRVFNKRTHTLCIHLTRNSEAIVELGANEIVRFDNKNVWAHTQ